MLHGHSHGNLAVSRADNPGPKRLDLCWDIWHRPVMTTTVRGSTFLGMRNLIFSAALFSVGCGVCEVPADHCSLDEQGEVNCDPGYVQDTNGDCVRGVDYEISCTSLRCHGAEDQDEYITGDYQVVSCTWHCAYYAGQPDQWVSLDFEPNEKGCWQLASEFVSSGVCD